MALTVPSYPLATETLPSDDQEIRLKIGDILIAMQTISNDQLHIALHEQKASREMLGDVLVRLGFIDHDSLALALASRLGIPSINLAEFDFDRALVAALPIHTLRRCATLPLCKNKNSVDLAMADPFDVLAYDEIKGLFPKTFTINRYVASQRVIEQKLSEFANPTGIMDDIIVHLETGLRENVQESHEHPVVRLVNHILSDAVILGASDIHFEPEDTFIRIRYRIDGSLRQTRALHRSHWSAMSHRLKIMAGMNIADTRSIQDGRFQLGFSGNTVDFRVAIMPSVWGETIVVRILDHKKSLIPLNALGYSRHNQSQLETIFSKPQGLVFVTGPTGSGKTTTLYSILKQLSSTDIHIATLEEPVEFQLDLIRQTAIQDTCNLDFSSGIRGILRMDPDIILIGEVRDRETAQMALRAAMTGHQVFSTLHCNEALAAIPRLIDLGLSPRILAGNLGGLIAQRLVRKLCTHCIVERKASDEELHFPGIERNTILYKSTGCARCDHTGRKGRTVVAEVLPITAELDDLIAADAPRLHILRQARNEGFISMQQDGIMRAQAGEIALEDLCRVVDMTRLDTLAPDETSGGW